MNQASSQWEKIYFLTGIEVTRPEFLADEQATLSCWPWGFSSVNERFSYAKDSQIFPVHGSLSVSEMFSCYGG